MRKNMAQWASVVVALGSLLYCGYKDYGEFWKYLNISDTHYPIEFYEQVRGLMSVELPSTLGRNFSYAGYVSTFIADADQVKSIAIA